MFVLLPLSQRDANGISNLRRYFWQADPSTILPRSRERRRFVLFRGHSYLGFTGLIDPSGGDSGNLSIGG